MKAKESERCSINNSLEDLLFQFRFIDPQGTLPVQQLFLLFLLLFPLCFFHPPIFKLLSSFLQLHLYN